MEYNTGTPIYLQVIHELKKKMVKGELKPGEKMPSNRDLAVLYKVNQNTAARIYREMETRGYCFTKRGIGTFVSEEEEMFENLKKEMAGELGEEPGEPQGGREGKSQGEILLPGYVPLPLRKRPPCRTLERLCDL